MALPTQQICCAGEAPLMTHSVYLDTRCQKSKALGIQRRDKGVYKMGIALQGVGKALSRK